MTRTKRNSCCPRPHWLKCYVPLPPVLSPVHVVSDIKADDEDTDDVAVYAAMDEPDDNPTDVAPPKVRLVRKSSSQEGSVAIQECASRHSRPLRGRTWFLTSCCTPLPPVGQTDLLRCHTRIWPDFRG